MAPSVVLVPGLASLGSVFFAPLKTELESLGFADITIVNNPSVESVDELSKSQSNALQADIQHLQQTVQDLVDSSKDVIIAAHSYGGTVSLYASEGMWKHVRQAKGLQGGVVKAVLISSSLSLPGDSIAGDIAKWSTEHDPSILAAQQAARVETRNDAPVLLPDGLEQGYLSDMSQEEQSNWAMKGLRPCLLGCVTSETPNATIKDWRIAYLITAEIDPVLPEALQEHLISNAKTHGAAIEQVKKIQSGHFVHVTHVKEVAEWIKEVSR